MSLIYIYMSLNIYYIGLYTTITRRIQTYTSSVIDKFLRVRTVTMSSG